MAYGFSERAVMVAGFWEHAQGFRAGENTLLCAAGAGAEPLGSGVAQSLKLLAEVRGLRSCLLEKARQPQRERRV